MAIMWLLQPTSRPQLTQEDTQGQQEVYLYAHLLHFFSAFKFLHFFSLNIFLFFFFSSFFVQSISADSQGEGNAGEEEEGMLAEEEEDVEDDMEEEEEEAPKEGVELAIQMLLFPLTLPARIYSRLTTMNFANIFTGFLVLLVLYLCIFGFPIRPEAPEKIEKQEAGRYKRASFSFSLPLPP